MVLLGFYEKMQVKTGQLQKLQKVLDKTETGPRPPLLPSS